jgi:hypothetical protein
MAPATRACEDEDGAGDKDDGAGEDDDAAGENEDGACPGPTADEDDGFREPAAAPRPAKASAPPSPPCAARAKTTRMATRTTR